jgi:hypothetical protein
MAMALQLARFTLIARQLDYRAARVNAEWRITSTRQSMLVALC